MQALPMDGSLFLINLAALLLSVLGIAFFNSSEASLVSVNKIRIRHLAEGGHVAAQAAQRIMGQVESFFATISITVNVLVIFASSIGTALAIAFLGSGEVAVLVATVAMAMLIVIFGEITPKTLAVPAAERLSLFVARPIEVIMKLESTLIYLFTLLPRLLMRLARRKMDLKAPFKRPSECLRSETGANE